MLIGPAVPQGPAPPQHQTEGAGSLVFGGIRKSPRNRAFAAGASLWSDIIVLLNLFICQSKPRDLIPAALPASPNVDTYRQTQRDARGVKVAATARKVTTELNEL